MRAVVVFLFIPCACSISCSGSPPAGGDPAVLPQAGPDLRPQNPYDPPGPPWPDAGPAPPRRCSGLPMPPHDQELRLMTPDGRTRIAEVHVPQNYDPTVPLPLVLNLHGFLSNPWQEELLSGMKQRSEDRNFVLVYPQGSGEGPEPLSWNGPLCCPPATDKKVDDVGFFRLLLDELDKTLCIDRRRVYATGMSNGAFLSHRLGCELSDRIAAIAPVAGVLGLAECSAPRPVPVMHFHGTLDQLVPYNGGHPLNLPGLTFPSVADSIDAWVKHNRCSANRQSTLVVTDSFCETYGECAGRADVTLCTVVGGGHAWPGGSPAADIVIGHTTPYLHATDLMIDFFLAHPMPM